MPPKKHYYAGKMHYYAGIMLDAPHIVLCSKLCRHNVSTPTEERDFLVFCPARKMVREQKRGKRGRGRKETLTDKPLDFVKNAFPLECAH